MQGAALSNPHVGLTALGDSQTEGNQWVVDVGAAYGGPTYNEGKTGAKAGWALDRDHDQIPPSTFAPIETWSRRKSAIYLVMFGLNDVSVGYHPELSPEQRLALFNQQSTEICNVVQQRGAQSVLFTNAKYPPEYTDYVNRNTWTQQYDEIKRTLAATRSDVYLVDLWARFETENNGGNVDWFNGPADLHYNAEGDSIVANEAIVQMTLDGLIS